MALVGKRCLLMFTTETSKSDVEVLATVVGVRDEPSLFNWSRFTTMQDSEQNRRFFLVLFDDGGECVASQTEVLDFIEAHNARFTTASEQCPFLSFTTAQNASNPPALLGRRRGARRRATGKQGCVRTVVARLQ